jgi:hypothetical protein
LEDNNDVQLYLLSKLRSQYFSLDNDGLAIFQYLPDFCVKSHRNTIQGSVQTTPTQPESLRVVVVAIVVAVSIFIDLLNAQYVFLRHKNNFNFYAGKITRNFVPMHLSKRHSQAFLFSKNIAMWSIILFCIPW